LKTELETNMSRLFALFDALPADLRASFARFEHEEDCLAVFYLAEGVPCVKRKRFLTWLLDGHPCGHGFAALSAGFNPIPCNPNDPEQVESALRQGLRQLETGEESPDELEEVDPALPDRLDELEQIFLRGLELIREIREQQ
jgi:hypothetical protein